MHGTPILIANALMMGVLAVMLGFVVWFVTL